MTKDVLLMAFIISTISTVGFVGALIASGYDFFDWKKEPRTDNKTLGDEENE